MYIRFCGYSVTFHAYVPMCLDANLCLHVYLVCIRVYIYPCLVVHSLPFAIYQSVIVRASEKPLIWNSLHASSVGDRDGFECLGMKRGAIQEQIEETKPRDS